MAIFKPLQGDLTSLSEQIDTFHRATDEMLQTEYPGMALRTAAALSAEIVKAGRALSMARRIVDNSLSAVPRGWDKIEGS